MSREQVIHNCQGRKKRILFPAKYIKYAKRTTKGADKDKFQTQRIHFESGIRLLQSSSGRSQDNLL